MVGYPPPLFGQAASPALPPPAAPPSAADTSPAEASESGRVRDPYELSDPPEEEAAVMLIVNKINEGREVWGEVTEAKHSTIDAGPDNARIHEIEFDVFCQ